MNTETPDTPPARISNAECLSILTDSRLVSRLTQSQTLALFRAVHALARRTMQQERNMRNREKGAFHTPDAVFEMTPKKQEGGAK